MNDRQDSGHLHALVTSGAMKVKTAMNMAALPLVVIPNKKNSKEDDWRTYDLTGYHFLPATSSFMLHECMLLVESTTPGSYYYANIRVIDDITFTMSCMIGTDQWVFARAKYKRESESFYVELKSINSMPLKEAVTQLNLKAGDVDLMRRRCVGSLFIFQLWCEFNNRRDRYMVAVTDVEVKEPTVKEGDVPVTEKKPAAERKTKYGPSIIYMEALPHVGSESNGPPKNPGTMTAHSRRGYHYTLKHIRYQHHPQYLKYKEMYRKPCYVGDRTTIVNGKVYTVMEANEVTEPEPV